LSSVIICVDDEKIVLDSLYSELEVNILGDFDIELAESGEEALEIIEELIEENVDVPLIISDFIMPNMKGDEFLTQAHRLLPDANKVMLTGQSSIDGVINAINNANLYRFMSKPWDSSDFMLTLNGAIKDYEQKNKIKKYQENLEAEIERKTLELQELNRDLENRVLLEVKKNREKEQLLAQQGKSSVMGEMMSAIIHQWKQPLAAVSALNDEISFKSKIGMLTNEIVDNNTSSIKKQLEHMSNTMNDFRNFFRPAIKRKYFIKDVLNDVTNLIGDILNSKGISIFMCVDEDYETIGFDNELVQVLINIINNSRDAIEENNSEIKAIYINCNKDSEYINLYISDCAGGIPENIIDKIFEPYFTTKSQDKGTGIGLDMSKSIITKVDGLLNVSNQIKLIDNKEYKGACFKISLKSV
jgi:C4-dicarboxylate-specific signal transduction histidine kinase